MSPHPNAAQPVSASTTPIRIGARRSPLAVAQANWVADRLGAVGVSTEIVGITTTGDVDRRALRQIGGTGVFAAAVRQSLVAGGIDLAVHSAKDLPTAPVPGLVIAAHPQREDVRDVVIGPPLAELPDGALIGTGSPRRAAQLQSWAASHGRRLSVVEIRGNVDRRIALVTDGTVQATVLAAAGLRRLGRLSADETSVTDADGRVVCRAQVLEPDQMLPAAGQGALAVEAVEGSLAAEVATALDHRTTHAEVLAERTLLAVLEAGCTAPVGVLARAQGRHGNEPDLTMAAVIGRTYASTFTDAALSDPLVRVTGTASLDDATTLGDRLARELLARLDRPTP